MKMKVLYWVLTVPFALIMLMSAFFYFLISFPVVAGFAKMGFPLYMSKILGTAKVLGVFAIISGFSNWLKEWAYAGFAINLVGAMRAILLAMR